ncbi:hypothetical protein D3C73_1471120 [compost metagenome]
MPEIAELRERRIKGILREIVMFKIAAEVIQRVVNGNQRCGGLILLFSILLAVTHNDADALENMQIIVTPPRYFQLAFHILIKSFGLCQ